MDVKLVCARCGAALVPAMSGLRCPRLAACGRGGYEETLRTTTPPLLGRSSGEAEA